MPRGLIRSHPARNFFSAYEFHDGDQFKSSKCNISGCNTSIKSNRVGNMVRHLKRKHRDLYNTTWPTVSTDITEENISSLNRQCYSKDTDVKEISLRLNRRTLIAGCIEMVTIDGRPFKCVEDVGFKKITDPIFNAMGITMNSEIVKDGIINKANSVRTQIENDLKDLYFALKIDTCTRHNRSILGINVQYIANNKIHIRTLGVVQIYDSTSNNLMKIIMETLNKYKLDLDKLFTITSDNGANMIKTTSLLSMCQRSNANNTDSEDTDAEESEDDDDNTQNVDVEYSEEYDDISDTILNALRTTISTPILVSMRCMAHTLQLAVLDILKISDVNKILNQCRSLAKVLRRPRNESSLNQFNIKRPTIDGATRWGSAFDMVVDILSCHPLCMSLGPLHKDFLYPDSFWNSLAELKLALSPARSACTKLQSECLLPGDALGIWRKCILDTKKTKSNIGIKFVEALKRREQVLFDNKCFLSAILLDMRYNVLLNHSQIVEAKSYIYNLWTEMAKDQATTESGSITSSQSTLDNSSSSDELENELLEAERMFNKTPSEGSLCETVEVQLNKFINEPRIQKSENVLLVWEKRKKCFPTLYKFAQVILALPSTQVTVERLFSNLKFILSDQRAKISKQILEDILLVRSYDQFNKTH